MHRSFALLRTCACSALLALSSLPAPAGQLEAGVGVYYGPAGAARSGSLAAGERILLSVRLESLSLSFGDGITGVQFGLDIDPRLTVHNAFPTTDTFFPAEVAAREWLLGLSQCKVSPISQYVLMLLEVEIVPGTPNISDLRVGVRDLTQFGERMGYTHCLNIGHFSRFYDAGDVVLNPSSPQIVHFSAAPPLAVRGRTFQLGWDVLGSASLDGVPVAASDGTSITADLSSTYTVEVSSDATILQSQLSVDVIEKPRVESFTVRLTESEPVPKAQLVWEVSGAISVEIDALPGMEHEIGRGIVTVPDPPIWMLRATNEWGSTTAVAAFEDQVEELPPLILDLSASPLPFSPIAPVTVSWSIFNADSAELLPLPGAVDPLRGSVALALNRSTELVLSAHNANGTVTRSLLANMAPVYIDEFLADPLSVFGGFPTRLSWSVRNADSVRIDPEPGAVDPVAGFVDVIPPADGTTYTLSATNADLTRTRTQTIAWSPPIGSFDRAPNVVAPQSTFEVELVIEGALSASLLPFPGALTPQSQTLELQLLETTTFELRVQNLAGETVTSHEIRVGPPEIQLSAISTNNGPWTGEPFTLHVMIEAAEQASLEPDFGPIDAAGGEFDVTLDAPTLFTCTASNVLGTSTQTLLVEPKTFSAELFPTPEVPYASFPYTLTATIVGAESATLTGFGNIPPTGGTFQVASAVFAQYTLTARRAERTLTRTLTIQPKKPDIRRLEVLNPPALVGQPFQIAVALEGAKTASLLPGGSIPAVGGTFTKTILVPTTFTLNASNPAGTTTQQLLVDPIGLSVDLTASTTTPFGGRPFTLTASLEDAESATLEPGFGTIDPAGGSFETSVSVPTTFTLTAHRGSLQVSDSVHIVPKVPSVALTASDATPFPDETITLTATIQGADTAALQPGFGNISPASNQFSTQVPVTTQFTLSASNPTGSSQATRTVTPKPPRFVNGPSLSPIEILVGESATLQWNADHFDQLTIDPIGHTSTTWGAGSLAVSPTTTTTYTFHATNTAGTTTRAATLQIVPFRIASFTASAMQVPSGQPVILAWAVFGQADVELVGIGPQPLAGTLTVTPTQTVSYTLRASRDGVTQQRSLTIQVAEPAEPTIYLTTDPNYAPAPPFTLVLYVPYTIWVVARNVVGGMTGYELSVRTPSCDLILAVTLDPPYALNVGSAGNYIVGLGACRFETDFPLLALQMLRLYVCGPDAFVLDYATPSSFGGVPGYASCAGELIPFKIGPPLPTGSVVAIALELQVDAGTDGNRLQWSITTPEPGEELRIYRRVDGGAERLVQTLPADAVHWLDTEVGVGHRFEYELGLVVSGEEHRSARKSVIRDLPSVSARTRLLPNIPNPFNPSTQLRFALAVPGVARLTIHDLSGRSVWAQQTGTLPAGEHALTWTGIDDSGRAVASGVYLVRLEGPDGTDTQRIALLK